MFSCFLIVFNLFLYASAAPVVSASTALVAYAYFFDVGQGHCFFFGTQDKKVAILIDAGSSKKPKINILEQDEQEKTDICTNIRNILKKHIDENTKILIIATHGDKDHYNWMKELLQDETKKESLQIPLKLENTFCILGGHAKDYLTERELQYRSDLPQFITNTYKFRNTIRPLTLRGDPDAATATPWNKFFCFNQITSPPTDELNKEIVTHLTGTNVSVKILSAAMFDSTIEDKKNESSIVTRVEYTVPTQTQTTADTAAVVTPASSKISFMIPGDAPGEITKKIIDAQSSKTDIQSTVLLASHHGATTHDTNNQAWITQVKPKYVVFSHGDVKKYKHPHTDAVMRALKNSEGITQDHVLFSGFRAGVEEDNQSENSLIRWKADSSAQYGHTFAQFCGELEGYTIVLTNCNVLSTYTQGNIEFKLLSDGEIDVSWDKKLGIKKDTADGSIQPPNPNQIIKDLLFKTDSKLTSLAQMIQHIYFKGQTELANTFLNYTVDMPKLESLDLTDTTANTATGQSAPFIQKNQNVKVKLSENTMAAA